MISKNSIGNMIQKLHLEKFINSQKMLLKDNRGGFLIPIEAKVTDDEYKKYRHLPINWEISPITKEDLPNEFSQKAVNTVDMFRRKTYDLEVECMIFFDIHTGNIVSCNFSDDDEPDEVNAMLYPKYLRRMHIASIHNHPYKYYSPPSGKNFEMLGNEFEEYEIISAKRELWILESKEIVFEKKIINQIRDDAGELFQYSLDEANEEFEKGYFVIDNVDERYGDFLLNYLNRKYKNIKLRRVDLDE